MYAINKIYRLKFETKNKLEYAILQILSYTVSCHVLDTTCHKFRYKKEIDKLRISKLWLNCFIKHYLAI